MESRAEPALHIDLPELLDDQAVRTLGTELRGLVGSSPASEVRLNAAALREVSTRGLGLLCSLQLIAARYGKELLVEACPRELRHQLAMARVPLARAPLVGLRADSRAAAVSPPLAGRRPAEL